MSRLNHDFNKKPQIPLSVEEELNNALLELENRSKSKELYSIKTPAALFHGDTYEFLLGIAVDYTKELILNGEIAIKSRRCNNMVITTITESPADTNHTLSPRPPLSVEEELDLHFAKIAPQKKKVLYTVNTPAPLFKGDTYEFLLGVVVDYTKELLRTGEITIESRRSNGVVTTTISKPYTLKLS